MMASLNVAVDAPAADKASDSGNGSDHHEQQTGGEMSPRRRSTRVSAMRAAEKMKDEDDYSNDATEKHKREYGEDEEDSSSLLFNKRRRLAKYLGMDQWDSHFAIQQEADGEVCALSDDSVLSSINEKEIANITKDYHKNTCTELTDEQRRERLLMIRQLESELRLEEAKLLMLKKLRMSQQMPAANRESNAPAKSQQPTTNMHGKPVNGNAGSAAHNMNKTPQQQQPMNMSNNQPMNMSTGFNKNNQQTPISNARNSPALQQTPRNTGNMQPTDLSTRHQTPNQTRAPQQSTPQPTTNTVQQQQNQARQQQVSQQQAQLDAQQRQMAVKLALRKQLEKTLLSIPTPKPLPEEPLFVPNLGQGDFVLYCGLDMAVQKVLKDKQFTDPKIKEPWACEVCDTDFTPYWKTIKKDAKGPDEPDNWKTVCEACFRAHQKKQVKLEHTARLKQAFVKALEQEKEIEQQIKDNKFDWSLLGLTPPVVASAVPTNVSNTPVQQNIKQSSTPPVQQQQHQQQPQQQQQHRQQQQQQQQQQQHNRQQSSSNNNQTSQQRAHQQQLAAAAAALQAAQRQQTSNANALSQAAQAQALLQNTALFSQLALASMGAFANPAALAGMPGMGGASGGRSQFNQRDQMAMTALAAQAAAQGANPFSGLLNNLPPELLRQLAAQQHTMQQLQQRNNNNQRH